MSKAVIVYGILIGDHLISQKAIDYLAPDPDRPYNRERFFCYKTSDKNVIVGIRLAWSSILNEPKSLVRFNDTELAQIERKIKNFLEQETNVFLPNAGTYLLLVE